MHVIIKQLWKGVGVWEQELTKHYIKLVLAAQIGHGIMLSTVGESGKFHF